MTMPNPIEPVAELVERWELEIVFLHNRPFMRQSNAPDGKWVRYADHASTIQSLSDRLEEVDRERDGWLKVVGDIAASVAVPDTIRATGTTADLIKYFTDLADRATAAESEAASLRKQVEERDAALSDLLRHFRKNETPEADAALRRARTLLERKSDAE